MIVNLRPKHEKLIRDIYRKEGAIDEQKLSFFKHYLQQKPMKLSPSLDVLRAYTKKYFSVGKYEKQLVTMAIAADVLEEFSIFGTSFEVPALKMLKTMVKELLRASSPGRLQKLAPSFLERSRVQMVRCFFFFNYAGTRSTKAEKITTHILLALCGAIDGSFRMVEERPTALDGLYHEIKEVYNTQWGSLSQIRSQSQGTGGTVEAGGGEAARGAADRSHMDESLGSLERGVEQMRLEGGQEYDEGSYNTETTASYNYNGNSCNYTDENDNDKSSSSSSSFFSAPSSPFPLPSVSQGAAIAKGSLSSGLPPRDSLAGEPKQSAARDESVLETIPLDPDMKAQNESYSNISQPPLPLSLTCTQGPITSVFITGDNFAIQSEYSLDALPGHDHFLLSLLSIVIKSPGILIRHSEKKLHSLNLAVVKPTGLNVDLRYSIFTGIFTIIPPPVVPMMVKQVIELSSSMKIPNIHNVLYSTISTDLYSDLIVQSNVAMTHYRAKILGSSQDLSALRTAAMFLLLQTIHFVNSIQVTTPPARITKSFYFLLRSFFPKKSLFRKVTMSDEDLLDKSLTIRYFKLFITKCQDKETIFLSLLRRSFQKEACLGKSAVPSELKLLVAKELDQTLSGVERCLSLSLFDFLVDISQASPLESKEHIQRILGKMAQKGVLRKRTQFEEHKRVSIAAKLRLLSAKKDGIYGVVLKSAVATLPKSEVHLLAAVFRSINDNEGLDECRKIVDVENDTHYDVEEDERLCNRAGSVQGSSIRSGTTFGGVRKSSIRLFELFKRNK